MDKKNLDAEALPTLASLQDYYPEVLGEAFIINTDWLFKTFMAMLKAVLDRSTLSKIHVLKHAKSDLLEFFDPENLLPEHGGTSDFRYEYSLEPTDDEEEQDKEIEVKKTKTKKKKKGKKDRKRHRKEDKGTELFSSHEDLETFATRSLERIQLSHRARTISGELNLNE